MRDYVYVCMRFYSFVFVFVHVFVSVETDMLPTLFILFIRLLINLLSHLSLHPSSPSCCAPINDHPVAHTCSCAHQDMQVHMYTPSYRYYQCTISLAGESFKKAMTAIGKEDELQRMDPRMFSRMPKISAQEEASRQQALGHRVPANLGVDEFCGQGVPADCTETQQQYDQVGILALSRPGATNATNE